MAARSTSPNDAGTSDGKRRGAYRDALATSNLHHTTRAILQVMVNRGIAPFPSVALIARDAGVSPRTVIRHLGLAEAAGWLIIERRVGDDGRRRTNRYRLTVPKPHQAQDARTANGADTQPSEMSGCHSDHVTSTAEPSDNSDQFHVSGRHTNPKSQPDSESESGEPDAQARARDAPQSGSGGGARKRAVEGAGSTGRFQREIVADEVHLELVAAYVGTEGALEVGRAFKRWATGKQVRSLDGLFIAFFRTWTKKRGDWGAEGVTLSREMIARARARSSHDRATVSAPSSD